MTPVVRYPRSSVVAAGLMFWGVFAMRFQIPLLAGLALAGFLFLALLIQHGRIDRLGVAVLINFSYWLASGLLLGGVDLAALASPDFVNGDGRIFVYYVPMLLWSVYAVSRDDIAKTIRMVEAMAMGTLVLYFVWLTIKPRILTGGRAGLFFGFLTSHTGSGTFFGALAVFLCVYGAERRLIRPVLLGAGMMLAVFGAASREALLAVVVAAGWYLVRRGRPQLIAQAAGVGMLLLLAMPWIAPHTYERTALVFKSETIRAAMKTAFNSNWEPGLDKEEMEGSKDNILLRMMLWSYAIKHSADSPIVGFGYGRFNDPGKVFAGHRGAVYVVVEARNAYNSTQAHNSYLHVLVESGLIGLGLLLWFWVALYRRLSRVFAMPDADADVKAYALGAQGVVVFTLFAANFGHGLASPSVGLVTLTMAGIVVAYGRSISRANAASRAPAPGLEASYLPNPT